MVFRTKPYSIFKYNAVMRRRFHRLCRYQRQKRLTDFSLKYKMYTILPQVVFTVPQGHWQEHLSLVLTLLHHVHLSELQHDI